MDKTEGGQGQRDDEKEARPALNQTNANNNNGLEQLDLLPRLTIQGRHLKVTEAIRDRVETHVSRAVSHFMKHHNSGNGNSSAVNRIDVRLSARGGPKHSTKGPQLQKAEITVFTIIGTVRAEVELDNMYHSIDEASSKVERKLRKLKEKAVAKGVWHGHGVRPKKKEIQNSKYAYLEGFEEEDDQEDDLQLYGYVEELESQSISQPDQNLDIFRKKDINLVPMTIADAVESLQYLDHDFFMFLDKESNSVQVVYKRKQAGYGVLNPVFE